MLACIGVRRCRSVSLVGSSLYSITANSIQLGKCEVVASVPYSQVFCCFRQPLRLLSHLYRLQEALGVRVEREVEPAPPFWAIPDLIVPPQHNMSALTVETGSPHPIVFAYLYHHSLAEVADRGMVIHASQTLKPVILASESRTGQSAESREQAAGSHKEAALHAVHLQVAVVATTLKVHPSACSDSLLPSIA